MVWRALLEKSANNQEETPSTRQTSKLQVVCFGRAGFGLEAGISLGKGYIHVGRHAFGYIQGYIAK